MESVIVKLCDVLIEQNMQLYRMIKNGNYTKELLMANWREAMYNIDSVKQMIKSRPKAKPIIKPKIKSASEPKAEPVFEINGEFSKARNEFQTKYIDSFITNPKHFISYVPKTRKKWEVAKSLTQLEPDETEIIEEEELDEDLEFFQELDMDEFFRKQDEEILEELQEREMDEVFRKEEEENLKELYERENGGILFWLDRWADLQFVFVYWVARIVLLTVLIF